MNDLKEHLEAISEIKSKLMSVNGKIIFLTISGAHLYGFPSKDSDVDYRGTYIVNTSRLHSLYTPKNVIDITHNDNDIVMFELKKEIGLALKGNCNVIEHINATPILSTVEFVRLRQLVNNSFGKNGLYNSYKGMATFNYKKFILQGRNTVKKYLYVFRGLMAGIYVLQTGIIKPNIVDLNKHFKLKEVNELVKLKLEGEEKGPVPQDLDTGKLEEKINWLFGKIDEAYIKCKIPERPLEEDVKNIDNFLKDVRRDNLY